MEELLKSAVKDLIQELRAMFNTLSATKRWHDTYRASVVALLARNDLTATQITQMADDLATFGNKRCIEETEAAAERMTDMVSRIEQQLDRADNLDSRAN